MDPRGRSFLKEVLGEAGAAALERAADGSRDFSGVVVPRVALAWLAVAAPGAYAGPVPGAADLSIRLQKSDGGYGGHVSVGERRYDVAGASLFQLAGAVAAALGSPIGEVGILGRPDVVRLGKSIDVLVKAHVAQEERRRREVEKFEPAGQPHAQTPPTEAAAPTPTAPRAAPGGKPKLPKLPRPSKPPAAGGATVKVSKSEAGAPCPVCGRKQFEGDGFVGCSCFSSMAQGVKVLSKGAHYVLQLGPEWDAEAAQTLAETFGVG